MVTDQDIRRIAAEAGVDPRTVRRVAAGKAPRSRVVGNAIEQAAAKLGIEWKEGANDEDANR